MKTIPEEGLEAINTIGRLIERCKQEQEQEYLLAALENALETLKQVCRSTASGIKGPHKEMCLWPHEREEDKQKSFERANKYLEYARHYAKGLGHP